MAAEDENGDKMYTLHYRGFHVIFSEPLTQEEEVIFKKMLDAKRNQRNREITLGRREQ